MPGNQPRPTLDAILAVTRARIAALQGSAAELERRVAAAPPVRLFQAPTPDVGLIAEVKRRSPSQGAIRTNLDPVEHAEAYVRGGAVAVSVLTDEAHFGGSLHDLERVAAAVQVPVLRKDFILDELQIMEARAAGASAVLLIVRVLTDRLRALAQAARKWRLQTLIEIHTLAELEPVLARVPGDVAVVAESGVENRADVERLAAAGADFVLVGTSVARQEDPETAVRALAGVKRQTGIRS